MKVIFLDIDGVLNGNSYFTGILMKLKMRKLFRFIEKIFDRDLYGVHKEKVRRLAKIVHKTDAKVVMSSSWRGGYWRYVTKGISDFDYYPKHLVLLDYYLKYYNIAVIDTTPSCIKGKRQDEIITWLARHETEVDNFVILDDEWSHLELFQDNKLVLTCDSKPGRPIHGRWYCREGLRSKHVRQAIRILNER